MKPKRIAFLIAALLIIVSAGIYFYYGFLFKEARNIASEKPDFSITAEKLLEQYNSDPKKADVLYLNKTIEITGTVTKETDSVITIENTVFCLFTKKIKEKHLDDKVTVKGKCIGYDELFQEVKLDQCTFNKPNN
ncbi:OB-fold putative lipoprotein [Flavobacterium piscisymbiosum]|uniref:OB-fold putative lipoprotein n=1 Tax=Flavobacterium piscisymbiosum TaxID=2893753 RepID=A0ABS8MKF7_9FLAO|nr:OB-fold putative lipoprotein [Flavobacterium sp. F-30]MCC9065967.1 OB-fold putative lipoprotein [Flavobacterium sp. F-30]